MENPKEFYSKIGRVWCPALDDSVVFNSMGFRHLLRKRGKRRPGSEQQRRLALLSHAQDIIADSGVIVTHEKRVAVQSTHRYGEKIEKTTSADFWVLTASRNDETIKIVIRQFEEGNKHFFSIY